MKILISALINKAKLLLVVLLASVLMPFDIYAAGETQIVPTYTSSTTQQEWETKIRVTNYCEGTNASTASCKLSFYVTGNYYGIIYVDGYDSSNTHWMNGTSIFVSSGYGEYNYNFYQNGIKEINRISIWAVSLVEPDSNVDLSQIIQLLTSINNYENSSNVHLDNIEDNTADTITEIQNVISQLVISNGYLETLSKLRQWNIPQESFYVVSKFMYNPVVNWYQNYIYNYPVFSISSGYRFRSKWSSGDSSSDSYNQYLILGIFGNYYNISTFQSLFTTENVELLSVDSLFRNDNQGLIYSVVKVHFKVSGANYGYFQFNSDAKIIPIWLEYDFIKNISTDFALTYELSNRLLDDLDIIANGTSQSNQQSQDLSSGTDSMQDQMDDLVGVEDSYNQQFNNSVNSIDFSNPLQQNQGLLGASNFVITVFNGLIANNPFSILIIIVCILLIGKKVIGK